MRGGKAAHFLTSVGTTRWGPKEQLGLPVAIHMAGPPAATGGRLPKFRMSLGAPILLGEVLAQHPTVRVDVVQAGWANLDQMIALLYAYPQVYVDVSFIDWFVPRAEFDNYLKRLTDAGFGKRIMFGSNQSRWPDVIPIAVRAIADAPFLTPEQKRDILYNNAARFLHLRPASDRSQDAP
jgi:predicted TIM-barrel fold metal-dependent hydrolase